MFIKAERMTAAAPTSVSARCPKCMQIGTFELVADPNGRYDITVSEDGYLVAGQRRCPNPACRNHIFVVHYQQRRIKTYPALTIDFDTSDVPSDMAASLSEAITCHANECYVASAIMVRKTLEQIIKAKGATGRTLPDRIRDLKTKISLPQAYADVLENLRLLGNDAAHPESEAYDVVGEKEVGAAIGITKEILKFIYQTQGIADRLTARLKQSAS